jgi:hypothetical protein
MHGIREASWLIGNDTFSALGWTVANKKNVFYTCII